MCIRDRSESIRADTDLQTIKKQAMMAYASGGGRTHQNTSRLQQNGGSAAAPVNRGKSHINSSQEFINIDNPEILVAPNQHY